MNNVHYLHIDKHISEYVIIIIGFGLLKLKKKKLQELNESLWTWCPILCLGHWNIYHSIIKQNLISTNTRRKKKNWIGRKNDFLWQLFLQYLERQNAVTFSSFIWNISVGKSIFSTLFVEVVFRKAMTIETNKV